MTDQSTEQTTEASPFWEAHYQKGARPWTGRPNAILQRFVSGLPAGTALDLGCGEGNSAIWLARQGWQVMGVDVSATALARATQHAVDEGVSERAAFAAYDLNSSFPEGQFDLVYALYLESPVALQREHILRQAAQRVRAGGLLLIVLHGSKAPWSWEQAAPFPTPQQVLDALALPAGEWHTEFLGNPERELTGPNGQVAMVRDIIVALKRLS